MYESQNDDDAQSGGRGSFDWYGESQRNEDAIDSPGKPIQSCTIEPGIDDQIAAFTSHFLRSMRMAPDPNAERIHPRPADLAIGADHADEAYQRQSGSGSRFQPRRTGNNANEHRDATYDTSTTTTPSRTSTYSTSSESGDSLYEDALEYIPLEHGDAHPALPQPPAVDR